VSDNPYASPHAAPGSPIAKPSLGLDYATVASLCNVSGWLKFLGILNIVAGVMYCITIVGAVLGWIPIWIGILLNNASTSLRAGYDGRNEQVVRVGIDKLALSIKIIGILTLIGLVINVVIMLIYAVMIVLLLGAGAASSL